MLYRPGALLLAGQFILMAMGAAASAEEVIVDGIPHVRNGAAPAEGTRALRLEELWRVGGDDDDVLFGAIGQVLMDDAGTIYLLDRHLCEVQVFSANGEYLRTLSREGDGPGETRRPRDMLFLPDNTLGILQTMPGKIVRITLDGTPAGSIVPGSANPEEGGVVALFNAKYRGDHLVICGDEMVPREGIYGRTRFLSSIREDGTELARHLENFLEQKLENLKWNEVEDYFVHMGGLALGPDGSIYAAPIRDRYEIHVFGRNGSLERVIEREFEPRRRTRKEKDLINDTRRMIINGREIEKEIGDYHPSISGLWVDDDGQLWVRSSRSDHERPPGVFLTYDVFDGSGRLARQVAVHGPGDPAEDGLFLLGQDRAVVVRGMVGAALAMVGARGNAQQDGDEEEAAPLEVICYRLIE
jgi:hypothetical protein